MSSLRRRASVAALLLVILAGASTLRPVPPAAASPSDQDLVTLACGMPHEWLLRTWRGYRADRSGELTYISQEPDFVGSGLPHVGPWGYIQDVPMLWYGPGYIKAQGPVQRPVTLAGIAPTQAQILDYPFKSIDEGPMSEAIIPASARAVAAPPSSW